jgi:hypothetical protein
MKISHKIVALGLGLAVQSHAILGLGAHYAPNYGSLSGSKAEIQRNAGTGSNIVFDQAGFNSMQGLGVKLWIDFLPFIDIEATMNIQYGPYDSKFIINGPDGADLDPIELPVEAEFGGISLGSGFGNTMTDVTITYPFFEFPPTVSIAKFYAGAGMTYFISTPVLTPKFAEEFVATQDAATIAGIATAGEDAQLAFAKDLGDQLVKKGLNQAVGAHILTGARFKLPVIPIAAYTNAKYYFAGGHDSKFSDGIVLELGGGLAF